MKKIILIFTTILFSNDYMTYFSPGIQIGLNTDGMKFISIQLTIGEFNNQWGPNSGDFDSKGITMGIRIYNEEYQAGRSKNDLYFYIDAQTAIDPLALSGTGCGFIFNSKGEIYPKVKFWLGAFGAGTYDFILSRSGKHNFGLALVLPVPEVAFN